MAITTHHRPSTGTVPATTAPATPPGERRSRTALLGWAVIAAACLAVGALAAVTLSGGDEAPSPTVTTVVPAHAGVVANGSPRAIEGTVESPAPAPDVSGMVENGSPRAIDGAGDAGADEPVVSRMGPPR